mmetsp:Transcript_33109/g.98545  ORF Transcript_33109/g.98545 Transcript_33109/m.98545 type:complete len:285 (+) Transcript_33109:985-1839(+)
MCNRPVTLTPPLGGATSTSMPKASSLLTSALTQVPGGSSARHFRDSLMSALSAFASLAVRASMTEAFLTGLIESLSRPSSMFAEMTRASISWPMWNSSSSSSCVTKAFLRLLMCRTPEQARPPLGGTASRCRPYFVIRVTIPVTSSSGGRFWKSERSCGARPRDEPELALGDAGEYRPLVALSSSSSPSRSGSSGASSSSRSRSSCLASAAATSSTNSARAGGGGSLSFFSSSSTEGKGVGLAKKGRGTRDCLRNLLSGRRASGAAAPGTSTAGKCCCGLSSAL